MLPHAFHFHCAWHRLKNIHGQCGGGTKTNKAGWLFNILSKAHTTRELEDLKGKFYDHLNPSHLEYLKKLPDNTQYPAAQCAMADKVYIIYHQSAVSSGESMNNANAKIRD